MEKKRVEKFVENELVRALLYRCQTIDLNRVAPPVMKQNKETFTDVEEVLNVPYMNREETPLAMDIFIKKGTEDKEVPTIVLIHGGGLYMGDRKISRPLGRWLAHNGYLVFSIEYRLLPKVDVTQQIDDVCAGLDTVGRNLVDYNVDYSRLYLISESAGAYLATYVTAMRGSKKLQKAIGREPTRFSFKAIGLVCGMFYSDQGTAFTEQLYGIKTDDENFRKYMNPEDPEIINNLPPVYLLTSKGDFLNDSSFKMQEALKKAGKISHLSYYGKDDLVHAFSVLQIDNPNTRKLMNKMLKWFEEQSREDVARNKEREEEKKRITQINKRLEDGSINKQKLWQYLEERNSADDRSKRAIAIIDGTREYTYEQLFAEYDRYARVFSGLNICQKNKSKVAIAGTITAEPLFCYLGLNKTGAQVSMLSISDFQTEGNWKAMLKKEKITDLILSDFIISPSLWNDINENKDELGLRNILLLHSKMGGPAVGPAELIFNEFNYHSLKSLDDTVFIEDLFEQYEDTQIKLGKFDEKAVLLTCYSSETSKDTGKRISFKEKDILISETQYALDPSTIDYRIDNTYTKDPVCVAPESDFSSYIMLHTYCISVLNGGGTVILTFFGSKHPKFVKALEYYGVSEVMDDELLLKLEKKKKAKKEITLDDVLTAIEEDEEMYENVEQLKDKAYKLLIKNNVKKGEMRDYDYDIEE